MVDFLYNSGSAELINGGIDFLTETVKVMLVGTGYTPDRDHDFVDEGGVNDPIDHEPNGTGYAGGFGGAGRKALASKSITVDKAADRVDCDAADVTWTGIDVGDIAHLLAIEERTADTDSPLVSHHDFVVTTNGGDLTATIADIWRLSTV